MDETPDILTIKQAADLMQVNERTIRRWIHLGRIKYRRIEGTIRVSRKQLLGAIEKYRYGEPPRPDPSMG